MFNFILKKIYETATDHKFSEIFRGSAWVLAARIATAALGLAAHILVARLYGAEVVGIVAVVNSFLMIATIFTLFGTGTSVMRFIPEHTVKYSALSAYRVYRRMQILIIAASLIIGALFLISASWMAQVVFAKPQFSFYLFLASFFVVFKSLMVFNTSAVRGLRLVKVFAFMQFFPSLAYLVVLVLLTLVTYYRESPVIARLISVLLTAVLGWFVMEFTFKKISHPGDRVHAMSIRAILAVSMPMFLTSTMHLVIGQIGVLMIGAFRSEAEIGYFAVAVKLATLSSFVVNAVNTIAAPKFSEMYYSNKIDDLFYVAQKSARLIFWTTVPVLLILLVFGYFILKYAFGPDFVVAYPAMALMVAGQMLTSMAGSTEKFLNMTGMQKAIGCILVGATAVNVLLNGLLIPAIGIMGASLATTCGNLFWNFAALIYIKMHYGKSIGYFPLPGGRRN